VTPVTSFEGGLGGNFPPKKKGSYCCRLMPSAGVRVFEARITAGG
jgi:hypothetical protein